MTRAFVFPGQGSQAVGMGAELAKTYPVAKTVFDEVDSALSENLFKLMCDGPEDKLTLTENAQPALMAVSMAVTKVLEVESGKSLDQVAAYVAGHSLGEYSALCAAGAFSITDTARLLRLRGQAMQKAVPVGVGSMAAVMGVDLEKARELAKAAAQDKKYICVAANDNANGQVVLSGHMEAIDKAVEIAREFGARRCVKLPVSAPFHCPLMQPAAEEMERALAGVKISSPVVPVVANVVAEPVTSPEKIRELLVRQMTGSVRWREGVLAMKELGVTDLVELGSGKVLSGMVRRIDKSLKGTSLQNPEDIKAFIETL